MRGGSRGAWPGPRSGTGPPEGVGRRRSRRGAREGGAAGGVARAVPARARWGPCPRRPYRAPRARSTAWSATPRSGRSARGQRRPAAARPAGRRTPGSRRPLGERRRRVGTNFPVSCRPAPPRGTASLTARRHVLQARQTAERCQSPDPRKGAPSERGSSEGLKRGEH